MTAERIGDATYDALTIVTNTMSAVQNDPTIEHIVKEYTLIKLVHVYHYIIGEKYNDYQKDSNKED